MHQNLLNLGQILKEKREDQGLSLKKVSEWTKINVHTLQAIEEGQADQLPVYTYLRGFILSYAKTLGISEKKMEKELAQLAPKTEGIYLSSVINSSFETENLIEKDLRLAPVIVAISILFILGSILVFTNMIQSYKKKLKEPEISETQMETEENQINTPPVDAKNRNEKQIIINNDSTEQDHNPPEPQKELKEKKQNIILSLKKAKNNKDASLKKDKQIEPVLRQKTEPVKVSSPQVDTSRSSDKSASAPALEIIVKALGDVQVSYKVDKAEQKELSLKEDQFEVLTGKENVFIKTEKSDLIYIFYNGKNKGLFGSGGRKEQIFFLGKESVTKKGIAK